MAFFLGFILHVFVTTCISYCPGCHNKILDQSNVRKEKFTLVDCHGITARHSGKSMAAGTGQHMVTRTYSGSLSCDTSQEAESSSEIRGELSFKAAHGSLYQQGSMFQSSHSQASQRVVSSEDQMFKPMSLGDAGRNGVKVSWV